MEWHASFQQQKEVAELHSEQQIVFIFYIMFMSMTASQKQCWLLKMCAIIYKFEPISF